jgi:hypothetical protein
MRVRLPLSAVILIPLLGCGFGGEPPRRGVFAQPAALTAPNATQQVGEACGPPYHNGTSCMTGMCVHGADGTPNGDYFCTRACDPLKGSLDCPSLFMCLQLLPGDETSFVCAPPKNWKAKPAEVRTGRPEDWPFPTPKGS